MWLDPCLTCCSCAGALLEVSPLHCLVVLLLWPGVVLHAKLFSHQRGPVAARWQFRTGEGRPPKLAQISSPLPKARLPLAALNTLSSRHGVALPAAAAAGQLTARVQLCQIRWNRSAAGAGMSCSGRRLAQSTCGAGAGPGEVISFGWGTRAGPTTQLKLRMCHRPTLCSHIDRLAARWLLGYIRAAPPLEVWKLQGWQQ
jgi:hypothetical protein